VTLSWPANSIGFVLSRTADLNTATWLPLTNSPLQINDRFEITLIQSSSQNHFFRLERK